MAQPHTKLSIWSTMLANTSMRLRAPFFFSDERILGGARGVLRFGQVNSWRAARDGERRDACKWAQTGVGRRQAWGAGKRGMRRRARGGEEACAVNAANYQLSSS